MSERIKDGGPAFPTGTQVSQNSATGETTTYQYLSDGVSMRDYFAAKSMQALIASRHIGCEQGNYDEDRVAKSAYEMADAMLEAREAV